MKLISSVFLVTSLALPLTLPAHGAETGREPGSNAGAATPPPVAERASKKPQAARPPVDPRPVDSDGAEQPGQAVYQILLGEIALQRGDPVLASKAYANLALRSRDPGVIERAVAVAGMARRFDIAADLARLWVEVDPESKQAQQTLASAMILSNQLDDLAPQLIRMLEVEKNALPENLLGLNRMLARNPDRRAVFLLIERVCRPFFGMAEAHYAVAVAAGSAGELERAEAESRRALALKPEWEQPALLLTQFMMRRSIGEAVAFLDGFVDKNPEAREARLMLARLMIAEKRYVDARKHFEILLKSAPDSPEIVLPAAILALQQNDIGFAEAQLKHYLSLPVSDKSYAYYYLGQIAEDDGRKDEAIAHYGHVGVGEQYLPALLRRAQLVAAQGRLDEARKLLSSTKTATPEERIQLTIAEATLLRDAKKTQAAFDLLDALLARHPDDVDLLYETALLGERLGHLDVLETRLRKVISLRPDSAPAYNALGYTLADHNLRLAEARELIEKALALSPEDYTILDSMGWVIFRQGDAGGALTYIERAAAKRDDPEIAAHLGEVLWTLGRADDARRVLQEAARRHPDNEELNKALKKFAP